MTLDRKDKRNIADAIHRAEELTSGEIRVHLKKKCGADVLSEAKKVFRRLKMHRTHERNGVLIFVALDSRRFAILGDEGIHKKVGASFWDEARDRMAAHFLQGLIREGILGGVSSAGEKLKKHFPRHTNDKDELSNKVTIG